MVVDTKDLSPTHLLYRIEQCEKDIESIQSMINRAILLIVTNLGGIVVLLYQQLSK